MKQCIGCDFDGTLAFHKPGMDVIGKPIPRMVRRIKAHLAAGDDVEIFTARATNHKAISEIQDWTEKHLGHRLPVTNLKKPYFTKMYDDRAEGIQPNTGRLRGERTTVRRRLHLSR